MVEVCEIPWSLGQLSADLRSSVVWSSVGLVSFKQFRKNVFEEFEARELEFRLTYEQVTPYANEVVELEYIKEVQFVGKEEEFNLESFDLFDDDLVEETEETDSFLKGLEEVEISEEVVGVVEQELEEFSKPVESAPIISSEAFVSESEDYTDIDDLLGDSAREVISKPKVVSPSVGITVESKPNVREVVYREGMSLRQFLRENPRSTMDVVEKYFTRKEIMKDIQLGKVIKRGKKLFI